MNDTEFTIDKDIELPAKQGRVTSPLSLALRQMDVGDSTLMTYRQRNAAFAIAHGLNLKLASRRVAADQVRVWRIS